MTIRELYIINRALDGKDIYGLPKVDEVGLSEMSVDTIKEQLIYKGILESTNKFTDYGLEQAKKLHTYKCAKKHIQRNNYIIGIVDNIYGVMLLFNPLWRRYKLTYVKLGDSYGYLE